MNDFRQSTKRHQTRNFNTVGHRQYARSSSSSSSSSSNNSSQRAFVNLDSENLKRPYIISVNTSAKEITGTITAQGKVIKQLNSDRTQFNLSPYLSVGKNTIEILAQYSPSSSEIEVKLVGLDTEVVQQTRGSGVLTYTLTVMVL